MNSQHYANFSGGLRSMHPVGSEMNLVNGRDALPHSCTSLFDTDTDPGTDFRGAGVAGLMDLLSLAQQRPQTFRRSVLLLGWQGSITPARESSPFSWAALIRPICGRTAQAHDED